MSKRKTKPKARTVTVKWTLDKKRTKRRGRKQLKIKPQYLIQIPPPAVIKVCPRCGEAHEKSEPKKFLKPLQLFGTDPKTGKEVLWAQCSYWQLCPKTQEPIIFFDRYTTVDKMEEYVAKTLAEGIAHQEDQKFLDEIRTLVENTKKTGEPPLPSEINVSLLETKDKKTQTKTWSWVYDPNAPERMVKGTKKQAAEQRARVRAQEAKAKPLIEKQRAETRKELDAGRPGKKKK